MQEQMGGKEKKNRINFRVFEPADVDTSQTHRSQMKRKVMIIKERSL